VNFFLSKYSNPIDKKGRVSIPVSYRNILFDKAGLLNIVISPSIKSQCLEVSSIKRLEAIHKIIQTLDPYCQERDAFETILMGEAMQLCCDNEGRVVIPKNFLEHAAIDSQVLFVGKGDVFEIWNPSKFDDHLEKSLKIAKSSISILKNLAVKI
jgi:MraZ protein